MCNCIETANKALARYNTVIDTKTMFFNGKFSEELLIPTKRVDPKGLKAKKLVLNYCPFCGEKQSERVYAEGQGKDRIAAKTVTH